MFIALVAAFKTLLHRYLDREDLRVATLVANRNRGVEHEKDSWRPLCDTVILRTDLGGEPSLREVMRRVRATTLAALAVRIFPSKNSSLRSSASAPSSPLR